MHKYFVSLLTLLCLCVLPVYGTENTSINDLLSQIAQSKRDTGRISLYLEASEYYLHKSYSLLRYSDSEVYYANEAMKLSYELKEEHWKAKTYIAYARICNEAGNRQGAKAYIDKAELLSKYLTKGDMGQLYGELVTYYNNDVDSNYNSMFQAISKAASYYKAADMLQEYAYQLCNLGIAYSSKTKYQMAIDTIKVALAINQKEHYPKIQYTYDLLSQQYIKMSDYQQALKYSLLAVETATDAKDTSNTIWNIYLHLAHVYYVLYQYDDAAKNMQIAFTMMLKARTIEAEVLSTGRNLINLYYKTNQPGKADALLNYIKTNYTAQTVRGKLIMDDIAIMHYLKTKRYELARQYEVKLRDFAMSHSVIDPLQFNVYDYLINYYLETKQYEKVDEFCKDNDSLCHHYGYTESIRYNYSKWYKADSALGNYSAALMHYRMMDDIHDSLFNENKTKQLAQMQLQYETNKKEQNIQLLTKQSQLQQTQLQQTKMTKNFFLGGVGMMSLLLGLGYNRYRLKQQSNKILQQKQDEINDQNRALAQLVKEKEWLVKEMHHRVKNNLQIVISLLNSQSMYVDSKAAQKAIRDSQHRMHAMSLIHQKLYQADNTTLVAMPNYICELVDYLRDSFNDNDKIRFEKNVEEISLDIAQAIPVGLILNETITNAIKYAFPDSRPGYVAIGMKMSGDNVVLTIVDNGVGLPKQDDTLSNSLGMNLIKGLSGQLGGTYTINNNNGVVIEVKFPYVNAANNADA